MTERVLPLVLPTARIESGPRALPATDRVAIVASFATDDTISRSLVALTEELSRGGYAVVIVRASDDERPLHWPASSLATPTIVRKSNIGYDFGSWAVGLAMFPETRRKPYVILANDSLVGPFASLDPLLLDFEACTTDVWAATNTLQMRPHVQSFFVGYRGGVLSDSALKQFWTGLVVEKDKQRIIERYEFGLSQLLFAEGFTTSAAFDSERIVSETENPTVEGWKKLLRLGFPFVKRELLTNPTVVPDGAAVPGVVNTMFGTDPFDWLQGLPAQKVTTTDER
ncbi:rhamnan synthesis protein F [Microterricola gilva]|uniref:Rhamnan synthesis protein F n=1 Tax=Microterricola gilva TaxID=393267 RepID=A0A4Q8AK04_9MICO|nr:rhamnan synthesis F family protein [Microterricola gilva]RZU64351.1 rhamnan synthesis protein F [Microterricola gilva]